MVDSWRVIHPSAKNLVTILNTLGNIADEIGLLITSKGVEIKALDPAKIALIEVFIPPSAFMEYEVSGDLLIGLNLSSLVRVLPRPKKGDKITIMANEEFHEIIIEGGVRTRYKFRNIEVASAELPEINLEFNVKALALSPALRDAIKELEDSEGIEFITETSDYMLLKALGLNAQVKLSKISGSLLELNVSKSSKNIYDSDYLSRISDLLNVAEVVELQYGNEMPLSISFKTVDDTQVKYLLAPKT